MDAPEELLPPVIYTMENKPIVTCECPSAREGAAAVAGSPVRARRPLGSRCPAPAPRPGCFLDGGVAGAAAGPSTPQLTSDPAGGALRPRRNPGPRPLCAVAPRPGRAARSAWRARTGVGAAERRCRPQARPPARARREPSSPLAVVLSWASCAADLDRGRSLRAFSVLEDVRLYFGKVLRGERRR